jgi:hypothetical protein
VPKSIYRIFEADYKLFSNLNGFEPYPGKT